LIKLWYSGRFAITKTGVQYQGIVMISVKLRLKLIGKLIADAVDDQAVFDIS
jgi:hypothetical protein